MTQTFSKSLTRLLFVIVLALVVYCFGDGLVCFFIAEPFVVNTQVIVGFWGQGVIRFKGKAGRIYTLVNGGFWNNDYGRYFHKFVPYYRDEEHKYGDVFAAFVFLFIVLFSFILFFSSSTGIRSNRMVAVTILSHRSKCLTKTGTSPVSDWDGKVGRGMIGANGETMQFFGKLWGLMVLKKIGTLIIQWIVRYFTLFPSYSF